MINLFKGEDRWEDHSIRETLVIQQNQEIN